MAGGLCIHHDGANGWPKCITVSRFIRHSSKCWRNINKRTNGSNIIRMNYHLIWRRRKREIFHYFGAFFLFLEERQKCPFHWFWRSDGKNIVFPVQLWVVHSISEVDKVLTVFGWLSCGQMFHFTSGDEHCGFNLQQKSRWYAQWKERRVRTFLLFIGKFEIKDVNVQGKVWKYDKVRGISDRGCW